MNPFNNSNNIRPCGWDLVDVPEKALTPTNSPIPTSSATHLSPALTTFIRQSAPPTPVIPQKYVDSELAKILNDHKLKQRGISRPLKLSPPATGTLRSKTSPQIDQAQDSDASLTNIAKGALVKAQNKYGMTPLMSAAAKGDADTVKHLLSQNVEIEAIAFPMMIGGGGTALHFALNTNNYAIVKILIDAGANVNHPNNRKSTPLHLAASERSWNKRLSKKQMVVNLIRAGATIDAVNISGNTPLHNAAASGFPEIVQLLLKHAARTDLKNNEGKTAEEIAKTPEIAAMFSNHKAQQGGTPATETEPLPTPALSPTPTPNPETAVIEAAIAFDESPEGVTHIQNEASDTPSRKRTVRTKEIENKRSRFRKFTERPSSKRGRHGFDDPKLAKILQSISVKINRKITTTPSRPPVNPQSPQLPAMNNSEIVAWQLRGKNATPELYEQFFNDYFEDTKDLQAFIAFLRIFPYFSDPLANAEKSCIDFMTQKDLQTRVLNALEDHFQEINQQLKTTPTLEASFMESYNTALSSFRRLRNLSRDDLLSALRAPCKKTVGLIRLCKIAGTLLNVHPSAIKMRAPGIGDPVGFQNAGSNCWCNALLQMVVSIPRLREAYTTFANSSTLEEEPYYRESMLKALEAYDSAVANRTIIDGDVSQKVREALAYFSQDAIQGSSGHQEDICEAFRLITGASMLPETITSTTYTPIPNTYKRMPDPKTYQNTLYNLQGPQYSVLHVDNTTKVNTRDSTIDISLQGKDDQDFDQLFQELFFDPNPKGEAATYLVPDGPRHCLRSHSATSVRRQFIEAPQELFLSVKLFGFSDGNATKIRRQLDIPLVLSLPKDAVSGGEGAHHYELDSFVIHHGKLLESGHYYTYKKTNGEWWLCNDGEVTGVAEQEIVTLLQKNSNAHTTSYLHHYRLVDNT